MRAPRNLENDENAEFDQDAFKNVHEDEEGFEEEEEKDEEEEILEVEGEYEDDEEQHEGERDVWVGVASEYLPEAQDNDAFTNKIGGRPIWIQEAMQKDPSIQFLDMTAPSGGSLVCKSCSNPVYLVMQAYAPKDDLDRVIYLFACNNSKCVRKQERFDSKFDDKALEI